MKQFVFFLCAVFGLWSFQAHALSCAPTGDEETIAGADLIVRARITDKKTALHMPVLQNPEQLEDIITFEILDVYHMREKYQLPKHIEVRFSSFMKAWGPDLSVGDEGEFLFQNRDSGWDYAGPGGCSYLSDDAWEELRRKSALK